MSEKWGSPSHSQKKWWIQPHEILGGLTVNGWIPSIFDYGCIPQCSIINWGVTQWIPLVNLNCHYLKTLRCSRDYHGMLVYEVLTHIVFFCLPLSKIGVKSWVITYPKSKICTSSCLYRLGVHDFQIIWHDLTTSKSSLQRAKVLQWKKLCRYLCTYIS